MLRVREKRTSHEETSLHLKAHDLRHRGKDVRHAHQAPWPHLGLPGPCFEGHQRPGDVRRHQVAVGRRIHTAQLRPMVTQIEHKAVAPIPDLSARRPDLRELLLQYPEV